MSCYTALFTACALSAGVAACSVPVDFQCSGDEGARKAVVFESTEYAGRYPVGKKWTLSISGTTQAGAKIEGRYEWKASDNGRDNSYKGAANFCEAGVLPAP